MYYLDILFNCYTETTGIEDAYLSLHPLSQRRHILAHKKKKTTRQAYATLKTSVFLRSYNVKDSAHER